MIDHGLVASAAHQYRQVMVSVAERPFDEGASFEASPYAVSGGGGSVAAEAA
jgi:hypothetical protein